MRSIGTNDGIAWHENLNVIPTDEEEAVLGNPHASEVDILRVCTAMAARAKGPVSQDDIAWADAILRQHLPGGVARFDFSVLRPQGCGVLNFNGTQIRF